MSRVATTVLRGRAAEVRIGDEHPFALIGERINPTGRTRLSAELVAGETATVRADALAQVEAGARVLDLNAGIPGFDEAELLAGVVNAVLEVVDVPLCIDSSTPEVLEAVLPHRAGQADRELGDRRGSPRSSACSRSSRGTARP